jgi:hypothetical protein
VLVGEDGIGEIAVDDFRGQFPMAFGEQPLGLMCHHACINLPAWSDIVALSSLPS